MLLQETHSELSIEKKWKEEWAGDIYFSHGTSSSKGVCILIPHKLNITINDKITDSEGRLIILNINYDSCKYILCNVYFPTRDHKTEQNNFMKILQDHLSPFENDNLLVGGDFNLYLDPKLDKLDTMTNKNDNHEYRSNLISLLDTMDLSDAWRNLYPLSRHYTWHSRGKSSRLDYFFISEHLLNELTCYKILPGLFSDHSILEIKLGNLNVARGRGFWKFNANLLHDPDYVKKVKNIIQECRIEFSPLEDKGLVWEITKLKIRNFSVPYCIKKKKERSAFKDSLEKELENLLIEIDIHNSNESISDNYTSVKKELEQIEKEETNSIIFRSKLKWTEDGEKCSKFFLNLEKKNYTNKHISNLEINGINTSDPAEISQE